MLLAVIGAMVSDRNWKYPTIRLTHPVANQAFLLLAFALPFVGFCVAWTLRPVRAAVPVALTLLVPALYYGWTAMFIPQAIAWTIRDGEDTSMILKGREIKKTRPCVVVSPDELNGSLRTVIVAPMTTGGHAYPFRIRCRFRRQAGFVVLDQVRAVDTDRLVRRLGALSSIAMATVLSRLQEMFAS